jgi:DNA-binding transcriptional LysR family regulator
VFDWDDLRHFLAVLRTGSLAGASKALGVHATTVGRRIEMLEARAGTALFERHGRTWVPSAAGRALEPRAERIESEMLALERELDGADTRLAGTVRVTATEMLATRFITPRLGELVARYPDLTIDFQCTNRPVDLEKREADVALRLTRPNAPSLVTKRLAAIPLALYASAAYLERRGMPGDADRSLAGHDVVLFADARAFAIENDWMAERLDGARIVARSDSVSSIFGATVGGVGIALLPQMVAGAEPTLVRIPTSSIPEPRVIWQTIHEDLRDNARVRAVLDWLSEILTPPNGFGAS